MSYVLTNTRGSTIATIPTATRNTTASPLVLIGQGISLYGPAWNEDMYAILENFANSTTPPNPVEGMFWYDSGARIPNFYDGTNFIPVGTEVNSASVRFAQPPAANGVDFTVSATIAIVNNITGFHLYPTSVILIPQGTVSASTPPAFNLYVTSPNDCLGETIVDAPSASRNGYYSIEGSSAFLSAPTDSLFIQITTPATGGALTYAVRVFGHAVRQY